ncbi:MULTISPECIES: site-specific integrase [Hungatella]|uniref:site-specific integrase n=1 Tax=Hungatella TaxID=1649459 RepID=UPI0026728AB8|nr:site-specific integrase [Hungatella hathewayi]
MAKEVRRDNKERILRTGESQRPDGRYMYKNSKLGTKPIYSWKLVPTDKVPKNKRPDLSLREKIAELEKDLNDGIDPAGKKMTVCQLYKKQNSLRKNVKRNTIKGRKQFMNLLKKDLLGSMTIDTVKLSDAKAWAIRMSENGVAYGSIRNYKRSLKASFYLAIQDDYIRKNPFDFKLSDVLDDDTEEKIALTPEQETNLLAFMKADKVYRKYYDEVVILLNTGLRISELCGLTLSDIDMRNRSIDVNHQLLKDGEIGYYIELPKTKNGKREIPMAEQTYQAFKRLLKNRGNVIPFRVENHSNFLFNNQSGLPKIACNYDGMLRGLVKKYNKTHDEPLPHITPHTFRHTFCTNMANKGMNPNTLQYIMGHSNITMTLNYYAHGSYASAKAEMDRLCA